MEAAQQQAGQGQPEQPQKLKIDKFADGGTVCLKFAGTIDEDFDGKKTAATVKAKTLVLDLAEIAKISSFGIREWVDFMNALDKHSESIVLLECAPKVVDQLNMVANFAGKGRVFSFYAPYRCDYCDSDSSLLLQVDSDWDVIKSMKPAERPCARCGELEYFDEDPTAYFSFIAGQERFELDPEVAAFLSSKLNYTVSESARRLRIDKIIEGRATFLKLAGDLDGSFPREKLAEGLEGTIILDLTGIGVIDPAGAAEWRGFLQMITPAAESIFMLGVPPGFLEKLTKPEDLGPKAQVITFAMPYSCAKCATTASQIIDVEQHYDVLKFATPPEMKCSDCKNPTVCAATEGLLSHLRTLPKPSISPQTRKFIKEVQERKPEKKATTVAEVAAQQRRGGLGMVMSAAVLTAALVVGGMILYQYMNKGQGRRDDDKVGKLVNQGAEKRPAWLPAEEVPYPSKAAFLGECSAGAEGGLSCYGVSSFKYDNQTEARIEAEDAVLEAMVNAIGNEIEDSAWVANVRGLYQESRQNAMTSFDRLRDDPTAANYAQAKAAVAKGRKAVAEAFRKTAAGLIPDRASDEYWEEYEDLSGQGSRFLFGLKYDLPAEKVKAMVDRYSKAETALGATTVSVFPAIAWRWPVVRGGAVITALDEGALRDNGLSPEYVILEVQQRPIADAADFVRFVEEQVEILKDRGGSLDLKVIADIGGGNFKIPFKKKPVESHGGNRPSGPGTRPGTSITPWERHSPGGNRDDPTQ